MQIGWLFGRWLNKLLIYLMCILGIFHHAKAAASLGPGHGAAAAHSGSCQLTLPHHHSNMQSDPHRSQSGGLKRKLHANVAAVIGSKIACHNALASRGSTSLCCCPPPFVLHGSGLLPSVSAGRLPLLLHVATRWHLWQRSPQSCMAQRACAPARQLGRDHSVLAAPAALPTSVWDCLP